MLASASSKVQRDEHGSQITYARVRLLGWCESLHDAFVELAEAHPFLGRDLDFHRDLVAFVEAVPILFRIQLTAEQIRACNFVECRRGMVYTLSQTVLPEARAAATHAFRHLVIRRNALPPLAPAEEREALEAAGMFYARLCGCLLRYQRLMGQLTHRYTLRPSKLRRGNAPALSVVGT